MGIIQARFHLPLPGFTLDVDLQLPGRGVTGLFGHSGCGKTTLLRCIAGLEKVPGGELIVNGDVWQNPKLRLPTHRRPLGYVFQEASLFSHLSVLGNLRYGQKRSDNTRQIKLDQAIDLLGIESLLNRKPERLSGGERQRVAIARALAVNPQILLMDEPLAALDLKRKKEVLPYLQRLHDELEIPLIYVSHSPDEIAQLADHLVVMDEGRVSVSGPMQETLARIDLPCNLGEDVGMVMDAYIGAVDQQWQLARLDFSGGSLWVRDHGGAVGKPVRVRVLARDISIASVKPGPSSIQNVLCGQLDAIAPDGSDGSALVRVRVGEVFFVARITRKAVAELALAVNQQVWLQVKSIALMD